MANTSRADAPYQPVLKRRDSAWRYAVVLALAFYPTHPVFTSLSWHAVDIALGVASIVALRFRRRWPLPVAAAIVAATAISGSAAGPTLLAIVSLSTRRRWREIAAVALVALTATIINFKLPIWDYPDGYSGPGSLTAAVTLTMGALAVLVAWGLYVGSRRELLWTLRERADRLEREQDTRTEQARDAERAQIAREMHDVLAHRISQISMQAGAIAFRTDLEADELRMSSQQLQTSANAALDDLRVVLGVLRDPEQAGPLDAPQPTADDIKVLVAAAQSDGTRIVFHNDIDPDFDAGPDGTIGRTLYRITQECITNARKHASGTTLTIAVTGSPSEGIDFTATNPLPIGPNDMGLPRSGFGLIGLTERAELAGGTLTAQRNQHGFTVACHLPWQPEPATRPHEYAQ